MRTRLALLPLLLLTATIRAANVLPPPFTNPPPPPTPTIISTETLCHLPTQHTENFHLITNQDMSKVAALDTWDKDKWYLSLNSVLWEFYTNVDADSAQFDPTGNHLLLLAQHDNAWFLIKDNADFRPLGPNPCRNLILSPNGQHDACIQTLPDKKEQILFDGKPLQLPNNLTTFDEIKPPFFIPTTNQLSFLALKDRKAYLITNATIAASADASQISAPVLSSDGKHIAWATFNRGNRTATVAGMLDEKTLTTHIVEQQFSVSALTISESAASVAWVQTDDKAPYVMHDGHAIYHPVPMLSCQQLTLSPDGKHVAYVGLGKDFVGTAVVADDSILETRVKETAAVAFAQNSKSLQVSGNGHTEFFESSLGIWFIAGYKYSSQDGQLHIASSDTTTFINNTSIEGRLLAAKSDNAELTYLLLESPRNLQIEKPITDITRIVLRIPTQQNP